MSTVVAMNEETRRIEQFNDIVANIKPLMTTGKGKNQRVITGSAVVPLSLCFVDSRYQGMRTHKHLNRLRNKWDERKLTPIILVLHPEEYRLAVVDGQGRIIVAGEKGIDRLNAIILMDAPDDPVERLKFEAEYFIGQFIVLFYYIGANVERWYVSSINDWAGGGGQFVYLKFTGGKRIMRHQSGQRVQDLVNTTQIFEDGKLVSEKKKRTTKRIERVTEPDYIKLYTEAWSGKSGNPIPVGYRPLFLELVTRMSYCEADDHEHSQLVATGGIYQNDIMKALGLTNRDSLQKGLKALCDCNAIRRVQRGTYQVNPKFAAKGQWKYNPRVSQSSLEDFSDYYNEQIRMQSKKKDAAVRETDVPMGQRSLDLDHWN